LAKVYAELTSGGKLITFNNKKDVLKALQTLYDEVHQLKVSNIDKEGEIFRQSGVTLTDLRILEDIVRLKDKKAMGYLVNMYKNEDDLACFDDPSAFMDYKVEPYDIDLAQIKFDKVFMSLSEKAQEVLGEILRTWDEKSVEVLKADPTFLKDFGSHIDQGYYEINADAFEEAKSKYPTKPLLELYMSIGTNSEEPEMEEPEEISEIAVSIPEESPAVEVVVENNPDSVTVDMLDEVKEQITTELKDTLSNELAGIKDLIANMEKPAKKEEVSEESESTSPPTTETPKAVSTKVSNLNYVSDYEKAARLELTQPGALTKLALRELRKI
jgi:hypothetical protein